MNRFRLFTPCFLFTLLAVIGLGLRATAVAQEKNPHRKAAVFVHPDKLTAKDRLSFGPGTDQKNVIPIKGETTLVYVDLDPDARFAHPTQCILISAAGTRVIDGDWWLVLNGKALFRDGKEYRADFPIGLTSRAGPVHGRGAVQSVL